MAASHPGQASGHVTMRRPRVKPEHAPYRIAGGRIRIGGESDGLAAEITDPAGLAWTVLEAMDGSRSAAEVAGAAAQAHPGADPEQVRAVVDQLTASGYVEDAAGAVPAPLTERDRERHDRSLAYYRWLDLTPRASSWDVQARLRACGPSFSAPSEG